MMDPTLTLGSLFARIAAAHRDRPALVYGPERYVSYGALDRMADRVAARLTGLGLRRGDAVGVLHAKQPPGYAAILACLRLGLPYACLDERNPPPRQRRILDRLQPCAVVADVGLEAALDTLALAPGTKTMALEPAATDPADGVETTSDRRDPPIGSDPAYVMFTSGSTGHPKGVAIAQASVVGFVHWVRDAFALTPQDVVSGVNPAHFDNSVFDLYASLFTGAALAPVPRSLLEDPPALMRHLAACGVTVFFSVPSLLVYLQAMRAVGPDSLPSARLVAFGGEGFPKPELARLEAAIGRRAALFNVYGPTECTCICSIHPVSAGEAARSDRLAPLGRLAAGFRGLVLDGDRAVPEGEVGELCLIGPRVGLGYYNDPDRSRVGFPLNPLNPRLPERMYRTGDLVWLDPTDGLLHFVGRADRQIKHMGHRIELDEIELALNGIAGVRQGAVVYRRGHGPFGRIIAYVSGAPTLDATVILSDLRARLPGYMVPWKVSIMDDLVRNANGKIDRVRLAEEA